MAAAQQWQLQAGGALRGEYNDNYFFTSNDRDSAFVLSLTPFVTALRRTDTSEVAAVFALGANKVTGVSGAKDYVSGRAGVNASQFDDASTASGMLSISRTPSLQSESTPLGVVRSLAFSDNATIDGNYSRALTERWSVGAAANAYANRYDSVSNGAANFQNNASWSIAGNAGYAWSSRTQAKFTALFSHFRSDVETDDAVTASASIAQDVTPQLAVSAAVGYYWLSSDTAVEIACGPGPGGCGDGDSRVHGHHNGALYGGSLRYAVLERTVLYLTGAENLAPSGTGALSRATNVALSLAHRFTERLTGRIAAGYTHTAFPTTVGASTDRTYSAEVGATYALTERWTIEGSYRYVASDYSQSDQRPRSNAAFLSIAYNWPGATLGGLGAIRTDSAILPGAGPATLRQHPSGAPDLAVTPAPATPADLQPSPFDPFTVP